MHKILNPKSIALGLGLMLTTLCQAQQWSGEQNLAGDLFGTPAVAQVPGTNVLQAFYEGGDSAMWTRWRNTDGTWSQEERLGGQLYPATCGDLSIPQCEGFNLTPFAIQIPNTDFLYVFYRGADNTLRYLLRDNNGNWLPEGNLGGQMSGNLSAVQVPGTDAIQVFYRGADGNLKTQWGNLNFWVNEQDLGGQLFGPTCSDITNDSCYGAYATPAVIQIPDTDYLYVFYRGPDNTLRYRLRDNNGNWYSEGNLGGQMSSDPSAAQIPGTDQIQVFYRGAGAYEDGGLMYQQGNLNFWTFETPVGGNPEVLSGFHCDTYNPPSGCVASYSAPKAYVVGNNLWVLERGLNWGVVAINFGASEYYILGGNFPITDPIAAPIPGTNTIQIFYVEDTGGADGFLATRWFPN